MMGGVLQWGNETPLINVPSFECNLDNTLFTITSEALDCRLCYNWLGGNLVAMFKFLWHIREPLTWDSGRLVI